MRMRITAFLGLAGVVVALGSWAVSVIRQDPMKVVVVVNHAAIADAALDGLRQGLTERGWRENQTIRFVYDGPQPALDRLRAQAQHRIGQGADLVVSLTTPAALVARDTAKAAGVPLLFAPASDPVAAGLVTSLTHPGQAVTGVTFALQEPLRLQWLKRLVPDLRVVWIPYNYADPSPTAALVRLRQTAAKLDLTIETSDVRSAEDLPAALAAMPSTAGAIFIPTDAMLASQMDVFLATAWAHGLPVSSPHRGGVVQGALFSYGFDLVALGRQAARLADQILQGTPATDLPIEAADMDLAINLATANRLGLSIPDDVLRHAIVLDRPGG